MRRKSLFVRYFLSYLGIIIISVTTFGMLFYYFNIISMNAEVKSNQFSSVSQSLNRVDYMLESMSNIAYHFSSNEVDSGYDQYLEQRDNGVFADLMAQRLSSYMQNMTEDIQILLYFRGDTDIYLHDGKYRYIDFEEHIGKNADLTISGLFSTLNSSVHSKALRIIKGGGDSSQEDPLAAFIYPVPYMSLVPEASLAFLVTEREFTSIFNNYYGEGQRNTYLLDHNLNMVYQSESLPLDDQELAKLVGMKGVGTFEDTLQGKPVLVMRALSEHSGYSLVVLMEEGNFYSKVGLMRRVIIACVSIITVLSVLWALIMAVRNYRPIRELARSSAGGDAEDEPLSGDNELEIIQQRIDTAHRKNHELGKLIDLQRPYVVFTCLSNILRGKVDDRQELQFQMQCASIDFPQRYLQVLLAAPAGRESISEKIQLILSACEEIAVDGCVLYGTEILLEKQVAVIANYREKTIEGRATGVVLAELLQQAMQQQGVEISVGIGSACTRLEDVHTSYVEAAVVIGEYVASHSGSIMRFEEIPVTHSLDYSLSLVNQSLLMQSLKQGDRTAAQLALDRLVAEAAKAEGSFLITQYLCFDIANTLLRTIGQANGEVQYADLHSLRDFHTLEEFHQQAAKIVQSICDQFDSFASRKSSQLSADVIDYVSRNYRSNSLSLEGVAAHFEFSASHLSRFFKQATGRTFSQYITQLRMAYIKQQLTESDRQIKEIVTEAGYIDVASFVRKFKNAEGITPSQYRQITQQRSHK